MGSPLVAFGEDVAEEESVLLPKTRDALAVERLHVLGGEFEAAKAS